MKLSNIELKHTYNTYYDDNIIEDFYLKSLEHAKNYDRISAYFDSKIIALYSKGIENIYKNNGKIRFIFSYQLSETDFKLIKQGYIDRLSNILIDEIDYEIMSYEEKTRFSNLSFLIAIGMVDIKIAITEKGIMHSKFGLIRNEKDIVFFRGSNNETVAAVEKNHEHFEVSCSWDCAEKELDKILSNQKFFDDAWNNILPNLNVVEIPDVVKNKLISYSNGKLVNEQEIIFYDSIIMDYQNNHLIIKNLLLDKYNLNSDYFFERKIKKYVLKHHENTYIFNDNIDYIIINDIIDNMKKSSIRENYRLSISTNLLNYLEFVDYNIETRRELGKAIKQKNDLVITEYNKFKSIVDSNMSRYLRDKQMWDSFHIVKMIKSANFSVPGSGKTSIVYGAFAYLSSKQINHVDRIIMIGPKNAFISWKDEFVENFGVNKTLNLLDIQDNKFKNAKDKISALRLESQNKNLILINYDMLNSLEEVLIEIIDEKTLLVFDEVHKVKAIDGQRAKSALNISQNAKYKVVLTGTPIPNSYQDIYNMFNILYTDEYKTFFKFSPQKLKSPKNREIEKINEVIYPFFCRTTKNDLQIPIPNEDILIKCINNEREQQLFELIRNTYSNNILSMYIRLLQASNNPRLLLKSVDNNDFIKFLKTEDDDFDNIYLDKIDEELKSLPCLSSSEKDFIMSFDMTTKFWSGIEKVIDLVLERKQVLVWAIFIDTIERIEKELKDRNIKVEIIYGAVSQNDREVIINKFKKNEIQVLVSNPHTLAESVSLHKTCHDAIYFEYSFNLTHMLQSRDRINRLGLPSNQYTQYYYLMQQGHFIDDDTIDYKTYLRLKEKEEVMIKSVEGSTIQIIDNNFMEEIKEIITK